MVLARTEKRRHLAVLCLLNCRAEEPDLLLAFCVVVLSPPIRFRLSQLAILFLPHIFLGQLRANSCARQLRGFCFPGSSRTPQVPPTKHPLALGAAASRFWVPQENGARKRRNIHVLRIRSPSNRLSRQEPRAQV